MKKWRIRYAGWPDRWMIFDGDGNFRHGIIGSVALAMHIACELIRGNIS